MFSSSRMLFLEKTAPSLSRTRGEKRALYRLCFRVSAVAILVLATHLNASLNRLLVRILPNDVELSNRKHEQETPIRRKRIGFLSMHISGETNSKVSANFFPHILNKACYSHLWGYDYFFKTSWSFGPDFGRNESSYSMGDKSRCWLDFGHWHRVPALKAMLVSGLYDWVVWADADMVINDLAIPVETLLADLELHNKRNVHVIHASHAGTKYTNQPFVFSSFGVMIRNSAFGHRLLDHWLEFAKGFCPRGPYPVTCGSYEFQNSDQVGLWYGAFDIIYLYFSKMYAPRHVWCCLG